MSGLAVRPAAPPQTCNCSAHPQSPLAPPRHFSTAAETGHACGCWLAALPQHRTDELARLGGRSVRLRVAIMQAFSSVSARTGSQPVLPARRPLAPVGRTRQPGARRTALLLQASAHLGGFHTPSPDGPQLPHHSEQQQLPRLPLAPPPPQQQDERQQQWRIGSMSEAAAGGGGGGADGGGGGKGGGGGGGGDGDDEEEERVLDLAQVEAAAAAAKVTLPADMLETARAVGIRSTALSKYISLQALSFSGGLVARFPWVRERMIADDKFLFKVVAEIFIDAACATVAEVRKRGDEFWAEFEFYLSDLIVGVVLDVALVSLMAPRAIVGGREMAVAGRSGLQQWLAGIPSAALEASQKGVREYSVGSRFACVGVKFLEYSLAGTLCGFVGQGVANSLMLLKRHLHGEREDDVAVPPLLRTALVWGLFMGVSSNLRYQVVFGLERGVDMTIAKRVPAVAYATTVGIRFVNNVIGGENFIDLARWAGVQ